MNDCLPASGGARQRARPLDAGAAPLDDQQMFEQWFASSADLAGHSYAARRVLAMAAALFLRHGAADTSIRDITRACGLSPGAMYKHFASKDDLLFAVVHHGHCAIEDRITAAVTAAGRSARERTAAFVHAYVLAHLERPQMAQVVRREYLHLSAPRYDDIVARRRRLRTDLATLLRQGARAGEFDLVDGPVGATRAAVMMLDMCSRTSDWYDPRRSESPTGLAERYVSAALRIAGAR